MPKKKLAKIKFWKILFAFLVVFSMGCSTPSVAPVPLLEEEHGNVDAPQSMVNEGDQDLLESDDTHDLLMICQRAAADSLCSDSYFPPVEGMTLSYDLTSPLSGQQTQTRRIGPLEKGIQDPGGEPKDGYMVSFSGGPSSFELMFECTQDGMIVNDQAVVASLIDEMSSGDVEMVSSSYAGVTYPKLMLPGDRWQTTYSMIMKDGQSDEEIHFITRYQHHYVGVETVTTKAGTFEARRIDIEGVMDMGVYPKDTTGMPTDMLSDDGFFSIASMPISISIWIADCIGIVRSESTVECVAGCPQGAAEQTTYYELSGFTLP